VKIYRPSNRLFVELENGSFGEVSPLPGRSRESLDEAHAQLLNPKQDLFPSVAFALTPLPQEEIVWPTAALLMGSASDILRQAEKFADFTTAKVKVGNLRPQEAADVIKKLRPHFRLRIDINNLWTLAETLAFCSHFTPSDFEYLEDPPLGMTDFPIAADDHEQRNAAFVIWKPSVRGIPPPLPNLILSSAWESGIGIANIIRLAHHLNLPKHPIGIGTYHYLDDDFLDTPLVFSQGHVTIPQKLRPRC
jgi:O-succinylbenzoate synthase